MGLKAYEGRLKGPKTPTVAFRDIAEGGDDIAVLAEHLNWWRYTIRVRSLIFRRRRSGASTTGRCGLVPTNFNIQRACFRN
jgi:hypothetical protein